MKAVTIHATQPGPFPVEFSLAGVRQKQSVTVPMVLAAKRGTANPKSLILRLYQPTNAPQTLSLTVNGLNNETNLAQVSALEVPPREDTSQPLSGQPVSGGVKYSVQAPTALRTVELQDVY